MQNLKSPNRETIRGSPAAKSLVNRPNHVYFVPSLYSREALDTDQKVQSFNQRR